MVRPCRCSATGRLTAIRRAPLCSVCRTFAWHPHQWPQQGHHPRCPRLSTTAETAGVVNEDPRVRDYADWLNLRFGAANEALHRQTATWPEERDHSIWYEFQRQRGLWLAWWDAYLKWYHWPPPGYDEVKTYDENLSIVLRRAKEAGADLSGVPLGRHEDPEYKKEQEEEEEKEREKDPLANAAAMVKWGVIGYLAIQLAGAVRRK